MPIDRDLLAKIRATLTGGDHESAVESLPRDPPEDDLDAWWGKAQIFAPQRALIREARAKGEVFESDGHIIGGFLGDIGGAWVWRMRADKPHLIAQVETWTPPDAIVGPWKLPPAARGAKIVLLAKAYASKPGEGLGGVLLDLICQFADQQGVWLVCEATPSGISVAAWKSIFARYRFEENEDQGEKWYRRPQKQLPQ